MAEILDALVRHGDMGDPDLEGRIRERVLDLTQRFPLYP